jgi:hypothetical protein
MVKVVSIGPEFKPQYPPHLKKKGSETLRKQVFFKISLQIKNSISLSK